MRATHSLRCTCGEPFGNRNAILLFSNSRKTQVSSEELQQESGQALEFILPGSKELLRGFEEFGRLKGLSVAERDTTQFGGARSNSVALHPKSDFRLIHRNYGNTLVRIGGQYYPRMTLTLAISEAMLMMTSLLMATLIRFPHFAAFQGFLADRSNWYRFVAVVAVCQISLYYNELYDLRMTRNPLVLSIHMFRALVTGLLALAMLYYIVPVIRLERGILAIAG